MAPLRLNLSSRLRSAGWFDRTQTGPRQLARSRRIPAELARLAAIKLVAAIVASMLGGVLPEPVAAQDPLAQYDVCASGCPYRSIQAAINAAAPGATVRVGPGTYTGNVTLRAKVKLLGAGAGTTVVQGSGSQPVFLANNSAVQRDVVVEGLTVTGGRATSGAGIWVGNGAAPTFRNVTIENNGTGGGSAGGGALVGSQGDLLLENALLRNNIATAGAAIALWEGKATLRNSTIENTLGSQPTGSIADFGAIYVDAASKLTLENTTVKGHTAKQGGAVALLGNSTATITGGRFANNQATVVGAGIYVYGNSSLTISSAIVENNQAQRDGGGIYVWDAQATIRRCTVANNAATQYGGGIVMTTNARGSIEDTVVERNQAGIDGGGIVIQYGSSPLVVRNSVNFNRAASVGGGFKLFDHANPTVRDNRAEGNTAMDGAGMQIEKEAAPIVESNDFVRNTASRFGGAIVVNINATPQVLGNVISGNRASQNGGGMFVNAGSRAQIERNAFLGNTADGAGGGLVINEDAGSQVVENLFANNTAQTGGGGVVLAKTSARLLGNRIRYNRAGQWGGGLSIENGASSEVNGNLVLGNSAPVNGAGVLVSAASPKLLNNTILDNGASQGGDGVFLRGGGELKYNVIQGNGYGIRAASGYRPSAMARNNVYANRVANYAGIAPDPSDLSTDPLFVSGFHLSSKAAGQAANSPLIDAGQDTASHASLDHMTTRTDGVPDQGMVDLGFHYPLPTPLDPAKRKVFIPLLKLSR